MQEMLLLSHLVATFDSAPRDDQCALCKDTFTAAVLGHLPDHAAGTIQSIPAGKIRYRNAVGCRRCKFESCDPEMGYKQFVWWPGET